MDAAQTSYAGTTARPQPRPHRARSGNQTVLGLSQGRTAHAVGNRQSQCQNGQAAQAQRTSLRPDSDTRPGLRSRCPSPALGQARARTHAIAWNMVWLLPPRNGYSRMCRSFAERGQCATRPTACVTGSRGRKTHTAAKVMSSSVFMLHAHQVRAVSSSTKVFSAPRARVLCWKQARVNCRWARCAMWQPRLCVAFGGDQGRLPNALHSQLDQTYQALIEAQT